MRIIDPIVSADFRPLVLAVPGQHGGGAGPDLDITLLAGRWRYPLVPFAASAMAAFCVGLTRTTSSGGAPPRLPGALRWTMGNALNGT